MNKKNGSFPLGKIILAIVVAMLIGLGVYLLFDRIAPSTTPDTQSQATLPEDANVLVSVATWIPDAGWSVPSSTTQSTAYGELSGWQTIGDVTMDKAYIDPFEHKQELESMGYTADTSFDAGGPGSSMWGYKRTVDGKEQVLVLGYKTTPSNSNPNEPLQFNCPCQMQLSAFVSDPFTPTAQ